MVDIVNEDLIIINVINKNAPTEANERLHYPWLWVGDIWTDKKPVDFAKREKLEELKDIRDRRDFTNVTTNIGTFEVDTISQARITNAIMLTADWQTRNWTRADGSIVELTKADLQDVIKAVAERSDCLHNKWLELKALVEQCTTTEEVEAIDWEKINE